MDKLIFLLSDYYLVIIAVVILIFLNFKIRDKSKSSKILSRLSLYGYGLSFLLLMFALEIFTNFNDSTAFLIGRMFAIVTCIVAFISSVNIIFYYVENNILRFLGLLLTLFLIAVVYGV